MKERPPRISWYRTKLDRETLREVSTRNDFKGAMQCLGHLGLIAALLVIAVIAQANERWWIFGSALIAYGAVARFSVNALHELAHGTVFSGPRVNEFFASVFAFIANVNAPYFWLSHLQHHKFSLHPPYDREVEEPELHDLRMFLVHGIVSVDLRRSLGPLVEQFYLAAGRPRGEWQTHLFGLATERQLEEIRGFSRNLLLAYAVVTAGALLAGLWSIPVVLLLFRQFGALPFMLCNNTQHAGLPDFVSDFRLCSRTFYLAWPLRGLYWSMNYHIEHHMYPGVPCYNLPALHEAIRHDLPPCKRGLRAVWAEISDAVARQKRDPSYRAVPTLPEQNTNESERASGQVSEQPA